MTASLLEPYILGCFNTSDFLVPFWIPKFGFPILDSQCWIPNIIYDTDIEPKTGVLVIFPLNINHYTRRNTTDNERIAVAGNYIVTGKRNDSN